MADEGPCCPAIEIGVEQPLLRSPPSRWWGCAGLQVRFVVISACVTIHRMTSFLYVGLGNPGTRYEMTRHNLGIIVLRAWVASQPEASPWRQDAALSAEVATVSLGSAKITCLFPLTLMNASGEAVAAFLRQHEIASDHIVILHDDLDITLGEFAWRQTGGSARGHNGVRSIQAVLKALDMPRLLLGIGRPTEGIEPRDYVLQRFTEEELQIVHNVCGRVTPELSAFVSEPQSAA